MVRPVPSRRPTRVVTVAPSDGTHSTGRADDAELNGREVELAQNVGGQDDPHDRVSDEPGVSGERQRGQAGPAVDPSNAFDRPRATILSP